MVIRLAETSDLSDWRVVAWNVAELFGNPMMADDPEFIDYATRKIKQREAIAAVNRETNECVGFIAFSRHYNRITWLGVLDSCRCKGIGSELLKAALKELDASKEISVVTFREGYLPGQPARHLYIKHGFRDVGNTILDPLGNERCKLTLYPDC